MADVWERFMGKQSSGLNWCNPIIGRQEDYAKLCDGCGNVFPCVSRSFRICWCLIEIDLQWNEQHSEQ